MDGMQPRNAMNNQARVLCAIDFSATSLSALDCAVRLIRASGDSLRLLHVVKRPPASPAPVMAMALFVDDEHAVDSAVLAWRRLERLVPADLHDRVQVQVSIGAVDEQIARAAANAGAELIVMGEASKGLRARLFGSTTARLPRLVAGSVITVPASPVGAFMAPSPVPSPYARA
jgi:nucleotide-binding universal stress UspA family protein